MIKHLVINGGGPTGLLSYGALRYLFKNDFLNIKNIKSIYGTSIGGVFGVMISLKYDWDTLDDYLTKRPWHKVFKMEPDDLFGLYYNKGLFSFNLVEEFLKPLLEANELSLNTTLKEYYEFNNIDHHFFSTEMNDLKLIDISYKTHPDITLVKALEMTTAIPVLFKPVFLDGKCYIDGGILNNYPVKNCLENEECEYNEILGIYNHYTDKLNIQEDMNILEYLQNLKGLLIKNLQKEHNIQYNIPYEVKCVCDKNISNYSEWLTFITDHDKCIELIEQGETYGELFLNYHSQLHNNIEKEKENEKEKEKEKENEKENEKEKEKEKV
jgi:NTE family protein